MLDATAKIKAQLMAKENEIVRKMKFHAIDEGIEFNRKHNIILRMALRKFYCEGVSPLMRDIYEDNVKAYHEERKDP